MSLCRGHLGIWRRKERKERKGGELEMVFRRKIGRRRKERKEREKEERKIEKGGSDKKLFMGISISMR